MSWRWRISRWLVRLFLKLVAGFREEGTEHMPREGRLIVCPNHRSFWDPILVGAAATRELYFLAKRDLFQNRLFAALIRAYHAVPLYREGGGKGALKTAVELLSQEKAVVIFPEGTRNRTDRPLLPLKDGASLLAARTGAPLLPVFIIGTRDHFWEWGLRRKPLVVRFGRPIHPKGTSKADIKALTQALEEAMLRLAGAIPLSPGLS